MKYTKQQAEMLALLVVMGCAVVVLAFLYLVKPNFATIAQCKNEMKKTEAEITNLSGARLALAKAKNELDELAKTIQLGEGAVFSGLGAGPPLYDVCVQAATELNLKPKYGEQTNSQLLEFAERGPDGTALQRHYDEVSRTIEMRAVDFLTFCRFLTAVEKANPGLGVAHLEIDAKTVDAQFQGQGKVDTIVELSMVGIREGENKPTIDISGHKDFEVAGRRNPFGTPGGSIEGPEDPLPRLREALKRTRISGVWADFLSVEYSEKGKAGQESPRKAEMSKGEVALIAGAKMKYLGKSGESFVFEAVDHKIRFILETNWRGEVKTIKEEEAK